MADVNTAELAQALGITDRAVRKAVDRGTLIPKRRGGAGVGFVFDKEESIAAYRAAKLPPLGQIGESDAQPVGSPLVTIGDKYSRARADDKEYAAKLKELELKQKSGDLVATADVRRDAAEFMAVLKSALFAIPDRVAPQFGKHQAKLYEVLTTEINHALEAARSNYVGDAAADALG